MWQPRPHLAQVTIHPSPPSSGPPPRGFPKLFVISPHQPLSSHLCSLLTLSPLPGMPLSSQSVALSGPGINSASSLKSSQIAHPNLISHPCPPNQCSHSFVLGIKTRMEKYRSQVGGEGVCTCVCVCVAGLGGRCVEPFRELLLEEISISPPVCHM